MLTRACCLPFHFLPPLYSLPRRAQWDSHFSRVLSQDGYIVTGHWWEEYSWHSSSPYKELWARGKRSRGLTHLRERRGPLCMEATQAPHLFSLYNAILSLSAELWSEVNTDLRDLVSLQIIHFSFKSSVQNFTSEKSFGSFRVILKIIKTDE